MAEWDRADSPGCAIAVVQRGETVFKRGYGQANLDHGVPITSRTVFDIGSVSKQFTAAAIALLVQQGRLSLDDDVRKHIPEMPEYEAPVLVRQLIHHTSGVRDYLTVMALAGLEDHDVYTLDEVVQMIARQRKLNFKPGAEYLYSNSGYMLLAEIVERVSGRTFAEFVDEQMFGPLGMSDSRVYVDSEAVIPRRSTGYNLDDERIIVDHYYNFAVPGDGQVYTTVEDLARWDRAFYDGGVGAEGFADSLLEQGVLNDGAKINYAFGLSHGNYRGLDVLEHNGAWGGFRADMLRFPGEQTSVFTLCNYGEIDATRIGRQVADLFLDDRFEEPEQDSEEAGEETALPPAVELTAQQIDDVSGRYFNPASGNIRDIAVVDGNLSYVRRGGRTTELRAVAPREFRMVGLSVEVVVRFEPGQGPATRMRVDVAGNDPFMHEAVEPASYSAADLARFAGRYFSDELDVAYVLSVEEGQLYLQIPGDRDRLSAGFADYFTGTDDPSVALEFQRSGDEVRGFVVNAGRVRGVVFRRADSSRGE
ncbi:hypothetical protein ABI59_13365 [Acidobacteria bacterium Mor1]|nr:hypothetical protein ABI59_13365 [Acidobacteria bacterium Mor1]